MKTALITGSNKGIGFETAKQLAERGFQVFISGRDKDRLEKAIQLLAEHGLKVQSILMDVSDFDSIKAAAENFSRQNIQLDIIINNAAVLLPEDSKLGSDPIQTLKNTLQTNCYGALSVIHYFLPFINKHGKIINISSGGGSMSDAVGGWSPAYCVSKTMLNAMTRQLAYELENKKITVNAVCPGWVKTDMGGTSAPRSLAQGAETIVWLATQTDDTRTGKFFRDKKQIPW
jgi:NAD(P)-dependent dehydrogenase (short-subunit alcohol dehydrogenase family)